MSKGYFTRKLSPCIYVILITTLTNENHYHWDRGNIILKSQFKLEWSDYNESSNENS
jgi:hypothetical protein